MMVIVETSCAIGSHAAEHKTDHPCTYVIVVKLKSVRARPRHTSEREVERGDRPAALGRVESEPLADALDGHQNDLYHHLNVLEDAGLVGKFRDGSSRVHELSPLAEGFVPGVFDFIRARADA